VILVENPYPGGPYGAKGLGELPMDGPAPAVVNAIRSLGVDVREIPALPEVILRSATVGA
jgi:CO/xanthine dehydrogenase Mo-binding subunit